MQHERGIDRDVISFLGNILENETISPRAFASLIRTVDRQIFNAYELGRKDGQLDDGIKAALNAMDHVQLHMTPIAPSAVPAPKAVLPAAKTPAAKRVAKARAPKAVSKVASAEPTGFPAQGKWSVEQEQLAIQLRQGGKPMKEIAHAINRPLPATMKRLQSLKVTAPTQKAKVAIAQPSADVADIAKLSGQKVSPAIGYLDDELSPDWAAVERCKAHLDRLPIDDRFTAQIELDIAERVLAGQSSMALAMEYAIPHRDLIARVKAQIPAYLSNVHGALDPAHRAIFLAALRANAAQD